MSLNEGAHQLRLYSQGPNGVDPFTEKCLRDTNVRYIPCASLLVRLTKVSKGPKGKPLEVKSLCIHMLGHQLHKHWLIHQIIFY